MYDFRLRYIIINTKYAEKTTKYDLVCASFWLRECVGMCDITDVSKTHRPMSLLWF